GHDLRVLGLRHGIPVLRDPDHAHERRSAAARARIVLNAKKLPCSNRWFERHESSSSAPEPSIRTVIAQVPPRAHHRNGGGGFGCSARCRSEWHLERYGAALRFTVRAVLENARSCALDRCLLQSGGRRGSTKLESEGSEGTHGWPREARRLGRNRCRAAALRHKLRTPGASASRSCGRRSDSCSWPFSCPPRSCSCGGASCSRASCKSTTRGAPRGKLEKSSSRTRTTSKSSPAWSESPK